MNLMELFSEIRDFRRAEGRRYPLTPMLIIVVMSNGKTADRAGTAAG